MSKLHCNIPKKAQQKYIQNLTAELRDLRTIAGVTQGTLASVIGVSRQTYSSIEGGKRVMSWNTFLSLIWFFDYCSSTHLMLRKINAFPEELIISINNGNTERFSNASGIAGIPANVTDKLDNQALHAIRTVVMVEYARCTKTPGEEVVRAFEGATIRQTLSDIDGKTAQAFKNIKGRRKRK